MMNKKITLLFVLFLLLLSVRMADADIGPKPSVTVKVVNPPEGPYYVTLLAKGDGYGPWSTVSVEEDPYGRTGEEAEAFRFFAGLEDEYHFWGQMSDDLSGTDEFEWSYYPPEEFKAVLYHPKDGTYKISQPCKREAFYSYFTVDYEDPSFELKEDAQFGKQLLLFLFRVIVTIAIEYFIAFLMGYRSKKERIIIIVANVITQAVLNAFLMFFDYYGGALMWMILFPVGELIVFVIELVIYLIGLKSHPKGRAFLYTLLANLISAAFTLIGTVAVWSSR